MRKIVWMGMLVMLAMMGTVTAQSECGGNWAAPGASCTFPCHTGDKIRVAGTGLCLRLCPECCLSPQFTVRASCGGVTVECFGTENCEETSDETASVNDENGSCEVEGSDIDTGTYRCQSMAPEQDAELEVSGQGLVIEIPEK